MKKSIFLTVLTTIFFCNLYAQRDTVFVDQNDSVFTSLPIGYKIIDTVEAVTGERLAIHGQSGCGGGGTINIPPKNLNDTTYYFWSYELQSGMLDGAYFYYSDSILVDSILFNTSSSSTIQYTDTFKSNDTTFSLSYNCNAVGNGYHLTKTYLYQKRIEINILPQSTAGDTVFVDQNDSVYYNLPNGYSIIDTITGIAEQGSFSQGSTQCPSSGGLTSFNLPDTAYYIFWKVELKNNGLVGEYYFQNNSTAIDTLQVDTNTSLIQYTDTFRVVSDSVKMRWTCNAVGSDTVDVSSVVYFTRTEIRIKPISTVIEEQTQQKYILIFPNPAKNTIQIKSDYGLLNKEYKIFNIAGKLVGQGNLAVNLIDIQQLPDGLYFLTMPQIGLTKKFIKK